MPTHKSNWKRLRQDKVRRLRNKMAKNKVRTTLKKLEIATRTESVSAEDLQGQLKEAYKIIDQASRKRVFHPNTASRKKSRMARLVNQRISG